jgi:hypothetical protein
MIPTEPNIPSIRAVSTALTVASACEVPASGKQISRLAAALAEPVVSSHPAETPVRMALLQFRARTGAKSVKIEAELLDDGNVKWWASAWFGNSPLAGKYGDTISEALDACAAKAAEIARRSARENTIRARIEREMAEADAAEAALKATDTLPLDPFDGVTPADGDGR